MGLSSVLNIAKTGLGISQANLDIVARNVANADTPGYTTKTEGSGYGLFLALRMAREHGGTLEAEPIPRDASGERGAIFELRLPMSGEPGSKPAREAS